MQDRTAAPSHLVFPSGQPGQEFADPLLHRRPAAQAQIASDLLSRPTPDSLIGVEVRAVARQVHQPQLLMNDRRLPNQLPQIHGEDLDVSCWDATMLLLARTTNAWPIIQSISNHAQIGQQLTITEIMTNQTFRASIDQTIDPELVELVAHELNSNPDDITKAMVQLPLDTTTLPNHTRETINQYLHAWLETHQELVVDEDSSVTAMVIEMLEEGLQRRGR